MKSALKRPSREKRLLVDERGRTICLSFHSLACPFKVAHYSTTLFWESKLNRDFHFGSSPPLYPLVSTTPALGAPPLLISDCLVCGVAKNRAAWKSRRAGEWALRYLARPANRIDALLKALRATVSGWNSSFPLSTAGERGPTVWRLRGEGLCSSLATRHLSLFFQGEGQTEPLPHCSAELPLSASAPLKKCSAPMYRGGSSTATRIGRRRLGLSRDRIRCRAKPKADVAITVNSYLELAMGS